MKRVADVKYDAEHDDYIIELGDELCEELGWSVGDKLDWSIAEDGSIILRKIKNDENDANV